MTYARVVSSTRAVAALGVAALGVAIPISTAADSALLALVVLSALLAAPHAHAELWRVARTPAIALALVLFGFLLASCAWGDAPLKDAFRGLGKYLELALIPVFAWAAAAERTRRFALGGFLLAVGLNLGVSYGSALGFWDTLPGLHTLPQYPVGFRLSTTHNIMVALAAYVALLLAREFYALRRRMALLSAAFACVCIHNVLFVVIGRTGYVVLAVLLSYIALTMLRGTRGRLMAALALLTLIAAAYWGSPSFSTRLVDAAADLANWRPDVDDETSVGRRISYYTVALDIVREHPLTGVGVGGFAQAYAERVRGSGAPVTVNPHSDYLMLATQGGIPALALLVALYLTLWRLAAHLGSRLRCDMMRGLVLTMAVGGLFNTLLMDHVEGLLFAWGTGVLYARANLLASDG